jgi:hypothetical protein
MERNVRLTEVLNSVGNLQEGYNGPEPQWVRTEKGYNGGPPTTMQSGFVPQPQPKPIPPPPKN